MSDSGVFKIRPAGRHILTIGRDLIQDPYAAVVELVKNAYDADATEVSLSFEKFKNTITDNYEIKITILDNGHGMSRSVVTDKWMVPSTDDKQIRKISPNGRVMQGRKGIGRYATGILGNDLFLETVANDEKTSLLVNWSDFEKAEYLSDVDILIETSKSEEPTGTTLIMTGDEFFLQEWDDKQFKQLQKELKKLMTPIENTKHSYNSEFKIYLNISGFENLDVQRKEIEPYPLFNLFDYRIYGRVENDGTGKLVYEMQKARNSVPEKISFSFGHPTFCGAVEFDIRVFDREKEAIDDLIKRGLKDESGNYVGKLDARRLLNENNGIGVYRNGFRIRPLGDPDFDWLELNKKRVQNPSHKIGSDQTIGIVKIESEEKSGLIEKTARDGLKENINYQSLVELTQNVIIELENRRFIYRNKAGLSRKTLKIEAEFEKLFSFDSLRKNVQKSLEKGKVDKNVSSDVLKAIDETEKEKNKIAESLRETVAIYQGQATLGKIINVVLHESRKPLEFFVDQVPLFTTAYKEYLNGNSESLPKIYKKINGFSENSEVLLQLFKKIDPLALGKRSAKKDIYLIDTLNSNFSVFSSRLKNITWSVKSTSGEDIKIKCWKQDLYSIFTNLIENSLYWMNEKNSEKKEISILVDIEDGNIEFIDYKDTGPGIENNLLESGVIFEPDFSTKPEGTGLGLTIAGESARRCGFELKALSSENGAYFRLEKLQEDE